MLKFSQKPIEPEKYLPAFIEFCKRQDDIIGLYIFGSRASGTHGPLSDIDIAVLLPQGLGRDVYNKKELFYLGKANELLHTDDVSFVVLNKAPLTIQYGVITDSKVLYAKDEEARLSYEETVIDRYMDFKPVLDEYDREFVRQIKEGTAFG
ncbi:MAG: nucleotidyltransferase domain-containing protein [Deltaproteobacteria bacterium]|nr:nucleotidyltransferase domain-containing protein [Deltaproteobacteria bacterium]